MAQVLPATGKISGAELHLYRVALVKKISGAVSEHQSTRACGVSEQQSTVSTELDPG